MIDEGPDLEIGDRVRLVEPFQGLPTGSEGVVFGFYRHPEDPAVAVTFGETSHSIPAELVELVEATTGGRRRQAG